MPREQPGFTVEKYKRELLIKIGFSNLDLACKNQS